MGIDSLVLFDLDGTLCDYEKTLVADLNELASPGEPVCTEVPKDDAPQYLRNRANIIRASETWWANLPTFELGMTIWRMAEELGLPRMILTQGPKRNPFAWSGKKMWVDRHLGDEVDITITRDKGKVYGKILVDDWPAYILKWLQWRPRGWVIMPASNSNVTFTHPQVIRYDGSKESYNRVRTIMEAVLLKD